MEISNPKNILNKENQKKSLNERDVPMYKQVLEGLEKVPCDSYPGVCIVAGDSAQSIFSYKKSSSVVIAGANYGKGRLIVACHDAFLNSFDWPTGNVEKKFVQNVKNWLSQGTLSSDHKEIIDFKSIKSSPEYQNKIYKIITITSDDKIGKNSQIKLLNFLEKGGGIFTAVCAWSYAKLSNLNGLKMMSIYNFLRSNFGIILTEEYIYQCPTEISVKENMAKYSNFDEACQQLCNNEREIDTNWFATVKDVLEVDSKSVDNNIKAGYVEFLLRDLIEKCKKMNLNVSPSEHRSIKIPHEVNYLKVINQCYIRLNKENIKVKNPDNIKEFPGDYQTKPQLIEKTEKIKLKTKFDGERLSTGYYLPAGVICHVK
jgi:hypothetical protein